MKIALSTAIDLITYVLHVHCKYGYVLKELKEKRHHSVKCH